MARTRRSVVCRAVLTAALTLGSTSAAHAEPVDPAVRSTARTLAEEGLSLYDGGNFNDALDRFDRADALVRAPTMGLMAARCLEKLGRLVEASERYLAVSKTALERGASPAFKDAITEAARDYKAIVPRIPKLGIGIQGAAPDEIEVALDGKPVLKAMIGIRRVADPGHHRVEGRRGDEVVTKEVDLKEADLVDVTLAFKSAKAAAGAAAPAPAKPEPAKAPTSSGSLQRTLGWVSIGIGGAGVVLGAATLGMAMGAKGDLEGAGCDADLQCPASVDRDVFDRYNGMRALPTVGFMIGALGIGAGVALLLTTPKARPASSKMGLSWEPYVTPGGAGMRGVF